MGWTHGCWAPMSSLPHTIHKGFIVDCQLFMLLSCITPNHHQMHVWALGDFYANISSSNSPTQVGNLKLLDVMLLSPEHCLHFLHSTNIQHKKNTHTPSTSRLNLPKTPSLHMYHPAILRQGQFKNMALPLISKATKKTAQVHLQDSCQRKR